MKNVSFFKNLLAGLFLLAGLCAGVEGMAQQNHALSLSGKSQLKWIAAEPAKTVVQAEIDNLNNLLSQMTAGGASQEAIAKVQFHINVYYHIQQAINQGHTTQESYYSAWGSLADSDAASLITIQEKEALQNNTQDKLTQ